MKNYLTAEDIENMKKEIEYRKVVKRKEILEDVKEARAHGDLSENFEYKAAKRERGKNESRIRYLERMIKTAKIIQTTHVNQKKIQLGDQIYIHFLEEGLDEWYELVTTINVDYMENKISIECPLGKAIIGKSKGDIIEVIAPNGNYDIEILALKKQ